MREQQAFVDMEAVSESSDEMLADSSSPDRRRWMRPAASKLALAVAFGFAVAYAASSSAPTRPTAKSKSSDIVTLDTAGWSDVLGDNAMQQMTKITDAAKDTASATEVLTATPAPTAATTEAPAMAAAPVATQAPTDTATTPEPNVAPVDQPKIAANLSALAMQMGQAAMNTSSPNYKQYASISTLLHSAIAKVASVPPAAPAVPASPAVLATPAPAAGGDGTTTDNPANSEYAPKNKIGDGNPCPDDEETSSGGCFKKCADLTGGSHPIRTSAFSCCTAKPCTLANTWTHMGMCFGYDVAADSQESKCPHSPGACLTNEDNFNGMCYKKCSDLTQGAYPNRVAAATCCKKTGWECFLLVNLKTDASFAQGGGAGDGNSGTPSAGHPVMSGLTR